MADHLVVFISHTSRMRRAPAGQSFVAGAEEAVNSVDGAKAFHMGYFPAADEAPAQYSIRQLEKADIFLAVVGFDLGSPVPGDGRSYTELEFDAATQLGRERLVFLLDESAAALEGVDAWTVDPAQRRFRRKLETSGATVAYFTDVGDLKYEVRQAVDQSIRMRAAHAGFFSPGGPVPLAFAPAAGSFLVPGPGPGPRPGPGRGPGQSRVDPQGMVALFAAAVTVAITLGVLVWNGTIRLPAPLDHLGSAAQTSGSPTDRPTGGGASSGVSPIPTGAAADAPCVGVTAEVTSSSRAAFGTFSAGAAVHLVVHNDRDVPAVLPAAREVVVRGRTGLQYGIDDALTPAGWNLPETVQPHTRKELDLGVQHNTGGSDIVTVTIPVGTDEFGANPCHVTTSPASVAFGRLG